MLASASLPLANCAMELVCVRLLGAHRVWRSQPTCKAAGSCTQSPRGVAIGLGRSACLADLCVGSGCRT